MPACIASFSKPSVKNCDGKSTRGILNLAFTSSDLDRCCEIYGPCGVGQGHCNSDSECADGLTCGKENCWKDFSNTTYWKVSNWHLRHNCCFGCTVNGKLGDGTKQGTCKENFFCRPDGTCNPFLTFIRYTENERPTNIGTLDLNNGQSTDGVDAALEEILLNEDELSKEIDHLLGLESFPTEQTQNEKQGTIKVTDVESKLLEIPQGAKKLMIQFL